MKKSFFITLCLIFAISGCRREKSNVPDPTDLGWLEGSWERLNGNDTLDSREVWTRNSDGFNGIGIDLAPSGDTMFMETLMIREINDTLNYIAFVDHNATEIYFALVKQENQHIRFENPDHDFPKFIDYKRSNDSLYAQIGDERQLTNFVFKQTTHERYFR